METGRFRFGDWFVTVQIMVIGFTEAVHLCGLLFGWSFLRCTWLLTAAVLGAAFLGAAALALGRAGRIGKGRGAGRGRFPGAVQGMPAQGGIGTQESVLYVLFLLLALSQLIFIRMGDTVYVDKDMTVETVGSFLAADGIYRVNPLTGLPYQTGMPSRLKILCLPTLYGCICRITGLEPATVVRFIVPELTLIGSYIAFSALGRCLFPQSRRNRALFLTAVSLLAWTGIYGFGMDGLNLLCWGWRGETIRNMVLMPWLLSLCMRKKWKWTVLCILAEACITWTLYGLGVCAAAVLGMASAGLAVRVFSGKEQGR